MSYISLNESGNLSSALYKDCQQLTEITIPEGVRRIGESCFENCRSLKRVILPHSLVSIQKRAFAGCVNLESVDLPDGVQLIAEETFQECTRLDSITIPAKVRSVSNRAFAECTSLQKIQFEGNEIKIVATAFEACIALPFEDAVWIAEHFVRPMDIVIRKSEKGIASRLRTFAPREFSFDGVPCASIESVLEAFKFPDPKNQEYVCGLPARDAYYEGQKEEAALWQESRRLYWKDQTYMRDSEEYQGLLDQLFQTIFEQDAQFRLDTAFLKNASVTSKDGSWYPERTVLTKEEHINRLLQFSNSHMDPTKKPATTNGSDHGPSFEDDVTALAGIAKAAEEKAKKKRRIVVMGGSFNPPTLAHSKLMISAVNALRADLGIFVPSSDAYVRRKMHKQGMGSWILSEEQRLLMLQSTCQADMRLAVSTCEYQDDGRGHTFETMKKLQKEYPDALLYFLVGGDKLNIIDRWRNSRAFFENFDFAVVKRNGTYPEEQIRENRILSLYSAIFHMVPEPEGISEISSSLVRKMLSEGDGAVEEMLDPDVYEMLRKSGWTNMDITSFRGEYDFLSNFYEAPVVFEGLRYLNNEAAFQAQKCLTEEEKYEFTYLTAAKAKRRGRQVDLRSDWEDVKAGLMEEIVRAKFEQNPHLKERLTNTGDRKLIEGNTWNDTYWGVDTATGKGKNMLGEILMKVREDLG